MELICYHKIAILRLSEISTGGELEAPPVLIQAHLCFLLVDNFPLFSQARLKKRMEKRSNIAALWALARGQCQPDSLFEDKLIIMDKLINQYKNNPDFVYHTWFVNNDERLKAFRSIQRGVKQVIEDIKKERFPNDFKGSSLEVVLNCITEQKQVFEGAAHPFYWKPKLRIPDIYENQDNKVYFGRFLENCLNASSVIDEILSLEQKKIKGLGPAVASILYFLHPTLIPPCNTAIVRGFNSLFGEKIKLGSWKDYLKMREIILQKNEEFKADFSNDLGAFSGFLFEVGVNNILADESYGLSEQEREKVLKRLRARQQKTSDETQEKQRHNEIQFQLLRIGQALGYDVIAAANDRSKSFGDNKFSFISLGEFPHIEVRPEDNKTIQLIDVVWFVKNTHQISCAFEVETSTSIYSGILRLHDLAASLPSHNSKLYIIVPDARETEAQTQLKRAWIQQSGLEVFYILSSDLLDYCDALCKFGEDYSILEKIARK